MLGPYILYSFKQLLNSNLLLKYKKYFMRDAHVLSLNISIYQMSIFYKHNYFSSLKAEIAVAIPASNDEKYNRQSSRSGVMSNI